MSWTDEREATLRKLHADGMSFSLIAAQLGGFEHTDDKGRSACIGKANRIGLSGRPKKTRSLGRPFRVKAPSAPKPLRRKRIPMGRPNGVDGALASSMVTAFRTRKRTTPRAGTPDRRPPVQTTEHMCQIMQLNNASCRFPLWSAETPHIERFYCGTPEADMLQRIPYCRYHDRIIHAREPETMMQAAE